jgi:hypothetical protein
MPIPYTCLACGRHMKAADSFAGKRVKCPQCGHAGTVPPAERPAAPSSAIRPPARSPVAAEAPITQAPQQAAPRGSLVVAGAVLGAIVTAGIAAVVLLFVLRQRPTAEPDLTARAAATPARAEPPHVVPLPPQPPASAPPVVPQPVATSQPVQPRGTAPAVPEILDLAALYEDYQRDPRGVVVRHGGRPVYVMTGPRVWQAGDIDNAVDREGNVRLVATRGTTPMILLHFSRQSAVKAKEAIREYSRGLSNGDTVDYTVKGTLGTEPYVGSDCLCLRQSDLVEPTFSFFVKLLYRCQQDRGADRGRVEADLKKALASNYPEIVLAAIDLLGGTDDLAEACAADVKALAVSGRADVRAAADALLGRLVAAGERRRQEQARRLREEEEARARQRREEREAREAADREYVKARPTYLAAMDQPADADEAARRRAAGQLAEVLLHDQDVEVRRRAAKALARLGSAAAPHLPAMEKLLATGEPRLQVEVEHALEVVRVAASVSGPVAKYLQLASLDPGLPHEAQRLCADKRAAVRAVYEGLRGSPAAGDCEEAVQVLFDAARRSQASGDQQTREQACAHLVSLVKLKRLKAAVVIPEFVKLTNKAGSMAAIRSLGDLGPDARDAVPVLRALKENGDRLTREAATLALRKIEQ